MAFTDSDLQVIKDTAFAEAVRAIREAVPGIVQDLLGSKGKGGRMEDKERGFEIGKDESWFANVKRSYDEYQDLSLASARRSQDNYDRLNQLSAQALQNAVETANMTAKQAIKHADVAADAMWNPVQQGAADTMLARTMTLDDAALKAIGAVVAVAVAEGLKAKPA